ncbi:putative GTP-binding protein OBGM mitochondrial [Bienertia sinuspersici]
MYPRRGSDFAFQRLNVSNEDVMQNKVSSSRGIFEKIIGITVAYLVIFFIFRWFWKEVEGYSFAGLIVYISQERRMIDRFRLHVKGGEGGSGNGSLHRSRSDRYGKPDGGFYSNLITERGNGGRGGDVILRCVSAVWDFRCLQHHINGGRGGNGASKNKIGSRGEDKVVQIPVGTVIHLVEGEIPSTVEKPSSGVHPWDVPGTVTSDFHASDQLTNSSLREPDMDQVDDGIHVSSSVNDTAETLASIKPYSVSSIQTCSAPSHSHGKSSYSDNGFYSHYDNINDCESTCDDDSDLKYDSDISEKLLDVEEIQHNVAELTEEGQQIIVACGGEGGLGSVSAGRRSIKKLKDNNHGLDRKDNLESPDDDNQTNIRVGLPGSQASLILELKSIADVGLVGMPNAGKSTLLGAISRAKPTVGNYAFTTLRPNIGKLNYDELSISVADIPGLIKGAHENRGLGHAFLRHIERTKILAYVVDLAAALSGRKGIPPWEQLRDLVIELEHYREGLSDRPTLVVANKIDEAGTEDVLEELQRRVTGIPIFPVCAVLEEGIPDLKAGLRELVNGGELASLRLDNILVD